MQWGRPLFMMFCKRVVMVTHVVENSSPEMLKWGSQATIKVSLSLPQDIHGVFFVPFWIEKDGIKK